MLTREANSDLRSWHRFQQGGHPDYVAMDSLDIGVIWCVWHEGLPLYRNGVIPTNQFREACVSLQDHNGAAAAQINAATNADLEAVLARMSEYFDTRGNGGYMMLQYHLAWVLYHEGRRQDVLRLRDQNNFGQIRAIYTAEQDHHPHVHHLIEAVQDSTIAALVDHMRE